MLLPILQIEGLKYPISYIFQLPFLRSVCEMEV